jgi:hypothetical protein
MQAVLSKSRIYSGATALALMVVLAWSPLPARAQTSAPPAPPSAPWSSTELAERTRHRRTVEAVIWGLPLVNTDTMRQAYFRDIGAKYNDILYFSKFPDWRFQATTPNASTHHVYFNYNLKEGPVVLEVPAAVGAGLLGSMVNAWDEPVADIGPLGDDKGKGGKYLLLPPDCKGDVPAGYLPARFSTYNGYVLFRAIEEGTDSQAAERAIALVKKMRIYPLAQAGNPPEQRFSDIPAHPEERCRGGGDVILIPGSDRRRAVVGRFALGTAGSQRTQDRLHAANREPARYRSARHVQLRRLRAAEEDRRGVVLSGRHP